MAEGYGIISGTTEFYTVETADTDITGSVAVRQRHGRVGDYLESKGFGWLLETDDSSNSQEDLPLLEELDIDLKDIYYKIRCVLLPTLGGLQRDMIRDNPDFWGPLLIVLAYALISVYGQLKVRSSHTYPIDIIVNMKVVSWILTIWIIGSMIIFILTRVLGGEVTYSQTLGIIGYSLLPLLIGAPFVSLIGHNSWLAFIFKGVVVFWASYSAGSLLAQEELSNKKPLILYPTFLLYVYFISVYSGA
jgi:hypothetical protein